MMILRFLNQCFHNRRTWFLLTLSVFSSEVVSLWFQYIMELKPCVFCTYERCALFGIMGAGLVGIIAPKTPLRYVAITIWLYSAWKGISISWNHTMMWMHPSKFITCDFTYSFPRWLHLNKWLPKMLTVSRNCSLRQWTFMKLDVSQWLVGIFIIYFIVALLVLVAQLFKSEKYNLRKR